MRLVAVYGMYANGKKLIKEVRDVVHLGAVSNTVVAYVISEDGKSIVPAHAVPDFLELSTTTPGDGR